MTANTQPLPTNQNNKEISKVVGWLIDRRPMTQEPPLSLDDVMRLEQLRLLKSIRTGIWFIVWVIILSNILSLFV